MTFTLRKNRKTPEAPADWVYEIRDGLTEINGAFTKDGASYIHEADVISVDTRISEICRKAHTEMLWQYNNLKFKRDESTIRHQLLGIYQS